MAIGAFCIWVFPAIKSDGRNNLGGARWISGVGNFADSGTPQRYDLHIVAERLVYESMKSEGGHVVKRKMKMGGDIVQGSIPIDFVYHDSDGNGALNDPDKIYSCVWDHEDVNKQFVKRPAFDFNGDRMQRTASPSKCSMSAFQDVDTIIECISFPYDNNTRSFEPSTLIQANSFGKSPIFGYPDLGPGKELIPLDLHDGNNRHGGL